MSAAPRPEVRAFFDEATNTVSYLVSDPATKQARRSIDPVLDYDQATGKASVAFRRRHPEGGARRRG